MESRHVKSYNPNPNSKKKLRYASSKERSKKASADVFRSYKNRLGGGVTSAATRESFVHNPHHNKNVMRKHQRQQKNHRSSIVENSTTHSNNLTAIINVSGGEEKMDVDDHGHHNMVEEIMNDQRIDNNNELDISSSSTFAEELDLAFERNGSEVFAKFYREIYSSSRSLVEIMHNVQIIVNTLCRYMLSPVSMPETPTNHDYFQKVEQQEKKDSANDRDEFIVNYATTDILHLTAVLARDLRHEIHPYLRTVIIPRIVQDLLNPPPPPPDSTKQPIPVDVTIVESSFRTLGYIFKYDSKLVVDDMEMMRKYYGSTLGNKRELVRRLAAETFAPLIRKMKTQTDRERHIRRVLRALAATSNLQSSIILHRTQSDAVDGIAQLLFQIVRGVPGRLHSQGNHLIKYLFGYVVIEGQNDLVFSVVSGVLDKVCHHSTASNFFEVTRELFSVFHRFVTKNAEDSTTTT